MITISVPITPVQEKFIKSLVRSGRAANKAHAVRLSIDSLAENDMFSSLQRSLQEARDGKILYGNPRELIKKFGLKKETGC